MLTEALYKKAKNFATKTMRSGFHGEEAVQRAMVNCHKVNNWYEPFVMTVVYNCCRDIFKRGIVTVSEKEIFNNSIATHMINSSSDGSKTSDVNFSNLDLMINPEKTYEDKAYAAFVLKKVYSSLTKTQKKVFDSALLEDSLVDCAKSIGMNYDTFKTHFKNILATFEFYHKNDRLPENSSPYLLRYKSYNRFNGEVR